MPACVRCCAAVKGEPSERQRLGELEYDDEGFFCCAMNPFPSRRANSLC